MEDLQENSQTNVVILNGYNDDYETESEGYDDDDDGDDDDYDEVGFINM